MDEENQINDKLKTIKFPLLPCGPEYKVFFFFCYFLYVIHEVFLGIPLVLLPYDRASIMCINFLSSPFPHHVQTILPVLFLISSLISSHLLLLTCSSSSSYLIQGIELIRLWIEIISESLWMCYWTSGFHKP